MLVLILYMFYNDKFIASIGCQAPDLMTVSLARDFFP